MKTEKANSTGLTDEALALMAQGGDSGAVDELLGRYTAPVTAIAHNYFCVSLETDDIVQEGLLGLLSAVYSYSSSKNAAFRTYGLRCASNAICSALRKASGNKFIPLNSGISVEDTEAADGDPEKLLLEQESFSSLRQYLFSALSPFELQVLKSRLRGEKRADYIKNTGIPEQSYDNALQRIRRKLKNRPE